MECVGGQFWCAYRLVTAALRTCHGGIFFLRTKCTRTARRKRCKKKQKCTCTIAVLITLREMTLKGHQRYLWKGISLLFLVVLIVKPALNIYEHSRGHTKGHTQKLPPWYDSDPLYLPVVPGLYSPAQVIWFEFSVTFWQTFRYYLFLWIKRKVWFNKY